MSTTAEKPVAPAGSNPCQGAQPLTAVSPIIPGHRKLQQHVAVFRDYMQNKDDGGLFAAKLVGRNGDLLGFACPRGAHARRTQPRDDTGSSRRRRLLRRGLSYGEELSEGAPDNGNRGLVGLFLNASIERQFGFVQRKWLNWGQFDGLSNDPDPITGPDGRDFTWQRRTALHRPPTVCDGARWGVLLPARHRVHAFSERPIVPTM
jgi:hypothetical protein